MTDRWMRSLLVLAAIFLMAAISLRAQDKPKEIKKTPIADVSPSSGAEMFNSYCAPCHGKEAKGNGPAASVLKVPPANLTLLAKKNGGKFPADHVSSILKNGTSPAHGSSDMPIWGPLFSYVSGQDNAIVQMRISNLIHYLESIQEK